MSLIPARRLKYGGVLVIVLTVPLLLAAPAPYLPGNAWACTLAAYCLPYTIIAGLAAVLVCGILKLNRRWLLVPFVGLLFTAPQWINSWQAHNPKEVQTGEVTLLSYNVNSFSYKVVNVYALTQLLAQTKPDVVCLQECLQRFMPPTPTYAAIIASAGQYPYQAYAELLPGKGFGLLVFSRLPLRANRCLTDVPGDNTNGVQAVEMQLQGGWVRLYNMHLQSYRLQLPKGHPAYLPKGLSQLQQTWARQTAQAQLVLQDRNNWTGPLLLVGDLNNPPTGSLYHQLSRGLRDSFYACGNGFGTTYNWGSLRLRIDYLLASPEFELLEHRTLIGASDHKALLVRLRLRN